MPKPKTALEWIEISLAIAAILAAIGYGVYRAAQPGPGKVFCTQEAKQCPDGSYVSRRGEWCEFDPCPSSLPSVKPPQDTSNWQTYRNERYGFEVKYPLYGLAHDFSEHRTDDGLLVRFGADDLTDPSYDLPERVEFYISISKGTVAEAISKIATDEDISDIKQQNIPMGGIDFMLLEWTQPDCPPCSPGRFAVFLTAKNDQVYKIGHGYSSGEPGIYESEVLRLETLGVLQNILSTFTFTR